ncbi:MAG: hypothetical protein NXI09_03790 [Bacteroidetes bacterium]|nr:hypothetical protein [Bacteroidota bacterium]
MLRPVSILLILLLFLAQSFNSMLFVQYQWHKDYYAKERCEQRYLEENDCQGFCQIKALLQEDQGSSPQPLLPNFQEEEANLFLDSSNTWQRKLVQLELEESFKLKQNNTKPFNGFLKEIWNPPQV